LLNSAWRHWLHSSSKVGKSGVSEILSRGLAAAARGTGRPTAALMYDHPVRPRRTPIIFSDARNIKLCA